MAHDTKKWWKIWRKTNLLFQKWLEFGEFWSDHLKVSNIFTLTRSFCAKYITLHLKKYWGVVFHDTEESCKIWRKTDLWFGKLHKEFGKILPEHSKVSKFRLWWDLFIQSRKRMSLEFTGELSVITMKNAATFEEELTCQFKIEEFEWEI